MGAALGLKQYSSWIHCFRDILATEGIGGFYKVSLPCLLFFFHLSLTLTV